MDKPKKIISGSTRYVERTAMPWIILGYRIVKFKHWSDGKCTVVLEKK